MAWNKRLWWSGVLAWQCAAWQYGIIIDAGSGGSRLHLFRWPERVADPLHPQNPAITIPEEVFHVQVGVGISAFAKNVSGLKSYLDGLIDSAKQRMEPLREHWSLIPIYLKATAGARDLFQDQRDRIFALIREYLYECPFRFETDYWARTISGEEEGVYAWLTVNAIRGTFRSKRKEDTWGSIDMGGASTQLAFIPEDVSIIQNFFPLHLSYVSIHLYAHSYLEFGYNDANQRLVRQLLLSGGASGAEHDPLVHPCFPVGARFTQPLREPFFIDRDPIAVVGGGDVGECVRLARRLLGLNKPCFVPAKSRDFANNSMAAGACAIGGTYEPALYDQRFVAMGQYAKIARSMGLPSEVRVNLGDFYAGMQRLCATHPSSLEFDAEVDDPEALPALLAPAGWVKDPMSLDLSRCWKAIWFWTVLHEGFRFPADSMQIMFAGSLEGKQVGWALGSMTYDVNYYPWGGMWTAGSLGLAVGAPSVAPRAAALPPERVPTRAGAGDALHGVVVVVCTTLGVALGVAIGAPLGALWVGRRHRRPGPEEPPLGVAADCCWLHGSLPGWARWGARWLAVDGGYRPLRCNGDSDFA